MMQTVDEDALSAAAFSGFSQWDAQLLTRTPLAVATFHAREDSANEYREFLEELARRSGQALHARSPRDQTPLHSAVAQGVQWVAVALLDARAG